MRSPVNRLVELIESLSGFVVRDNSIDALEVYARERAEDGNYRSLGEYVAHLAGHPESNEWRALLNRITIKESYLFRGQAQFDALREILIPELVERKDRRELTLWSAGCAHGEEAATLAIVLNEHPLLKGWDWSVLGTDVDRNALTEARAGLYGRRAVARVPPGYLSRYFVRIGDRYELRSDIRDRITYRHLNLVEPNLDVGSGAFDFIFLRNVLIYFRSALQKQVISASARFLAEDGSIFLGPSESLLHLDSDLEARDLGLSFAYRHRSSESDTPQERQTSIAPDAENLHNKVLGPEVGRTRKPEAGFDQRIEEVVVVLESGSDPEPAFDLIDALRTDYPENALIHTLEAIARERTGDLDAAVDGYRAALYLDPELDDARFLLARAMISLGRNRRASRELRSVLAGLGSRPESTSNVLNRVGLPARGEMVDLCHEFLERLG